MLDPRDLAARRDEIVESCRRRGVAVDVDEAVARYRRVAAVQTELDAANRARNEHGRQRGDPAEGRRLKEEAVRLEAELAAARAAFEEIHRRIPNLVHPEVPVGGEQDYRVLRQVGEPRPGGRDHLALAASLDLVDFEGGARVAGQKWYFLKNEAVLLELALQRFAIDVVRAEGFTLYATPDVARPEIVEGIGFDPRGEETQIYSLANADLCLVGTAEITLGGLYAESVLGEEELPKLLAGISHCFRTEAGAAGRESKGLYRVHQFTKVEMFACTRPEDSEAVHERMLAIEERIFQALEIPYRVIDTATGDLGAPAWRKYDVEAWMPGRGERGDWGEVTSTSNCTDYQARRLRIRFRRGKKAELVHTLNGTAVAVPRTLVALLENHQRPDGSVAIPKALQPYLGLERLG
jgi:seryl-tRNA synthetase